MRKILSQQFFNRPTLRVAEELLGKFLIRKTGKRTISAMITEVEAYIGPEDKASHASRGKTKRTEVMFGKAGQWYIYMIYGMYYCLNIVTEKKEYPAAILIRSVEGAKGPGRVCRYFKIDKRFNAMSANKKTGLWIEDRLSHSVKQNGRPTAMRKRGGLGLARVAVALGGVKITSGMIKRGKRIGVDYAGKWKYKLWRLYI